MERPCGDTAPEVAGLYLHLPFCSAVCPYCDFAVKVERPGERQRYVRSLLREIELASTSEQLFDTVYLGGGTPSALPPDTLARLLDALRRSLRLAPRARLFLEANPEDVTARNLAAWRQLGVSFLSLGVQSLDDRTLRLLGRRHAAPDARRSVAQALAAGFETVSLDLIYGTPGQTPDAWCDELEEVVALEPGHLSCYELEVHQRTTFGKLRARGELMEPSESLRADLFLATHQLLADAGYAAYEVSSFARLPEHRSRHNQKYWRHEPYLGLGPSAHSFDGRRRWWNERHLARWARRLGEGERPIAGEETLDAEALVLETLMLGLRTADGVDLGGFRQRFGKEASEALAARLDAAITAGTLRVDGERLRPTLAGWLVADRLAAELAPEPGGSPAGVSPTRSHRGRPRTPREGR